MRDDEIISKHIDVVIPTYQETSRAIRAVKSVLEQTVQISSTHVLDDGSTIEIAEELELALEHFKSVKMQALPHSGHPGVVRRIGVLESSSEWVAFLDADDYWDIDKIERQLELATKSGSGLIYSNAWLDKEAQVAPYFSPISRLPSRLTTFKLLTSNYVINSSVLVRREHLLAVGGFADSPQVRAVEDYATWLRLSTVCQMAGIQDPLLTYTESESSFSKVNSGILPVMAIRDFRSWVSRSTMPVPMKAKYIFMSSVMIQYHTSRGFISRSLDGLRTKR